MLAWMRGTWDTSRACEEGPCRARVVGYAARERWDTAGRARGAADIVHAGERHGLTRISGFVEPELWVGLVARGWRVVRYTVYTRDADDLT